MMLKRSIMLTLSVLLGTPLQPTVSKDPALYPKTLAELGKIFDAGMYPKNITQALEITLAGLIDPDPFIHFQAADDFFALLKKLPHHECNMNHKLFKRGMQQAIVRSQYCHFLNDYVQQIFNRALINEAPELHNALVESILRAIGNCKITFDSMPLLLVLRSCVETCSGYATGSIGQQKFHIRVLAQAINILEEFFRLMTKTDQPSSLARFHAAEALITLIHQAAPLHDRALQQQMYSLGQEVYKKLGHSRYHKMLNNASKLKHTKQMAKLENTLADFEKTADF